jgi:enoyl-[acyl-carrier protein] reductase I
MSTGILAGKVGVVCGVANKRSIAWAIAQAWAEAGAKLLFSYQGERVKEDVEELAATFGADVPVAPCDVRSDEEIDRFFGFVKENAPKVDLLLHSIAFAPKEALTGSFTETSREAFSISHAVSAYSLIALSRGVAPLMSDGGSILAMSYLGAARGIAGFGQMIKHYEEHAPLHRSSSPSELGQTGVFLASDGAGAITGQVIYVDGGFQIMGM